jgi:hypothetical protein
MVYILSRQFLMPLNGLKYTHQSQKTITNGRADTMKRSCSDTLRSSLEKPHTLTLALSPQGRVDLIISPALRGGD